MLTKIFSDESNRSLYIMETIPYIFKIKEQSEHRQKKGWLNLVTLNSLLESNLKKAIF